MVTAKMVAPKCHVLSKKSRVQLKWLEL